jgi:hypothetical protein
MDWTLPLEPYQSYNKEFIVHGQRTQQSINNVNKIFEDGKGKHQYQLPKRTEKAETQACRGLGLTVLYSPSTGR